MNAFPNPLLLRALAPDQTGRYAQYELTGDFVYISQSCGPIVAQTGMVTDFASIPRCLWWLMDPEDPAVLFPSVIHDALYSGRVLVAEAPFCEPSRRTADAILREAMSVCGASGFQRRAAHTLVRLFGAKDWHG